MLKRWISLLLSAAMLLTMLPSTALAVETETLEGKTLSILGDSISTYTGVSNDKSVNATLAGSSVYYNGSTQSIRRADTWWQQTVDVLEMELLVNNSWSGSCILNTRAGTAGAYLNRCTQLHNDKTGEEPDIIAVFLGTNDFYNFQSTLGTADIDYDALITENDDGTYTYAVPVTACEAYAIMLHKMTERYPEAEIYCMNMLPTRDPVVKGQNVGQPTDFNTNLAEIIEAFGCTLVDLGHCGIDKTGEVFDLYITDRYVHPGPKGMDKMTEALICAMTGEADATLCDISLNLNHVTADNEVHISLAGEAYSNTLRINDGYENLKVTVTMGGKDITADCYADGKIDISAVTGDLVITASATIDKEPENYRWEFDGTDLVSVSTGDNVQNVLTRLAGTCESGTLKNARYQLAREVVLSPDRPWVVEWEGSGAWNGLLLSSHASSGTKDMNYLYRSSVANRLMAFGEYTGSRYDNYGVTLSDKVSDPDANHVYRVENRIAADGSNTAYLLVDGTELGAMDDYYIGGDSNQNKNVDWVDGKTFVFRYMGTSGHPLQNLNLKYLQVWEGGVSEEDVKIISLRYDDYYDVTGKTVEIIDAGTPTSYQVGYGVEENTVRDTAVVTLDGDTLVASGIGNAVVSINDKVYNITVETAPISLLLLIGQSNMEGNEGNAAQSIICPDGMVYGTYGDRYDMNISNATHYAPSALTGPYREINTVGGTDGLSDYPVYMLTERGAGRIGPDSGFAYEWVQQTGEKVWIVNAAHGGTSLNVWQPGTTQYEECEAMFGACQETLRKEIAAGHFTLSHMAYFWCQGCNDASVTAEWYVNKYLTMHEALKQELAFDHDSNPVTAEKTFEFGGIIPVRIGHDRYTSYREGVNQDTVTGSYYESFKDLRMSGPRVAQYWMGNNPDLEDIWTVCTIGEDWVWMPDGTNGVSDYFRKHYPNGTVDYTPQVAQSTSWYTPTTPKAVHDSIHYNQIGYNEVGRESVRNALIMMGINEDYDEETTVEFVNWTGYQPLREISASTTGRSGTLVVPMVSPITRCKNVTYTTSDGLDYKYYDLLAESGETTGTLTAMGANTASVNVVKQQPGELYTAHLSQLPEQLCRGVNLWSVLEHDPQFYYGGTHWGTHSSGTVYSVTIPVQSGDKLYATAWGKAGENGHASSNGIRVTFFDDYDVLKTMDPAGTYAEFSANGGYLMVPEGATAVNIPMWTNEDSNEIYILSRNHDESASICSICGQSSHTHAFSDWETVSLPTAAAQGVEQRTCACGESETRKVDGVWQQYALSDYLQALPANVCCDTNLWAELEHNKEYFANGVNWGVHSSGKVYSVTIPVTAGEKVYASSFGSAGTNGSSTNGIRCTFFDAWGVAKTMTPAEVYAEFSANGYLTAPEGTVAANIPMWTNADSWEIYLPDRTHQYISGVCAGCGDSLYSPAWEVGTIAAANGLNRGDKNRLRTTDYLKLADYGAVTVNPGYMLVRFVYDKDHTMLNGTDWLGSGVGFSVDALKNECPNGVYFRIALRATDNRDLTLDDLAASGVKLYLSGEEIPAPDVDFEVNDVASIGSWQDGAIWSGKLFALGGAGTGAVFDVKTGAKLGSLTLDGRDALKPHANSVCFGNTYYAEGDKYPLLYVNVYNNYASAEDRMEGTCCVYRITESENVFSTELVQVIRIGFTEDLTLWKSKENNGDVRPYGNFVVDTDENQLYAFVMRDANKTTRFFRFDVPALDEGTFHAAYGCNVVTLNSADINAQFDTEYFNYLQGCCYSSGMLLSVEGFGGDAPLRIVDLNAQTVIRTDYLGSAGLCKEPELLSVDPADGVLYYAAADGMLRSLTLEDVHFHAYSSSVTAPTCTEQGYTTYTCACGDSYVGDYTDARGYDWMLEDGAFNLLLIGNSFSEDASNCGSGMTTSQLLDILQAMLGEDVDITVGLCYSGGKGLNWHATQSEQGNRSYSLRVISSETGKWKSMGSYTSADALSLKDWDVVTLQHYEINTTTGEESNAYPEQVDPKFHKLEAAAEFMLDHVDHYAPDAETYFYMHWARAYAARLNESLATYKRMAAFFPEVLDYTGPESAQRFDTIIPVGLSVQNARTTYLAKLAYNTTAYADGNLNLQTDAQIGLQRDGGHLSFNVGRYIAALTFAETIVPKHLRTANYVLPDIRVTESVGKLPKEYTELAQKSVFAAVNSWKNGKLDEVTTIEGYTEDPTVAAGATLSNTALNVACGADAEAIKAAALAILPVDFAVDRVILPENLSPELGDTFSCEVTIRYGYTSLVVTVNCEVGEHSYTATVTPPTCTEQGYTTYTCACGDSYVDDEAAATGHSWDNGSVTTQPTCTTDGERTFTCLNDSTHTRTETVAQTGHTEDPTVRENEIAATCTKAGSYDDVVYCTDCQTELRRKTVSIPMAEHTPQVIPAVPPTYDAPGLTEGSRCAVCGTVLKAQETVPVKEPVLHAELDAAIGTLTVSGVLSDAEAISTPVFVAVYSAGGQLLTVKQPVDLVPSQVAVTLDNCLGAASVRIFRLNAGYLPDAVSAFAAVTK